MLNNAKRLVFESIKRKIDNNEGGPGGTGKTFLLNALFSFIRQDGRVALVTASFGIAATLLKLGRTAYSRFQLSFPVSLPVIRQDAFCMTHNYWFGTNLPCVTAISSKL